jgi:hypothetical protein
MTSILLVGLLPETVDVTDPALPPGMTAQKIQEGIDLGLKFMRERGWHAQACLVSPDETAGPQVTEHLRTASYDVIVIGAGVRLPPRSLWLFEVLVNAIHKAAPLSAIAFNTSPPDTPNAAERWLPTGA